MQEILVAKDYRELQPKFDEILSAVGDYFELFKNNTNILFKAKNRLLCII